MSDLSVLGGKESRARRVSSIFKRCHNCKEGRWISFEKAVTSGYAETVACSEICHNCEHKMGKNNGLKRGWHLEPILPGFDPVKEGNRVNKWYDGQEQRRKYIADQSTKIGVFTGADF